MYAVSVVGINSCVGTSEFTNDTFQLQGNMRKCTGEMLNLTKHDQERMVSGIIAWGVRRMGLHYSP